MSTGVKGILVVGTDLFHIFAKAIMGSVLHKKLRNASVMLAAVFLVGSIVGATVGGIITGFFLKPFRLGRFIATKIAFSIQNLNDKVLFYSYLTAVF